MKFIGRETELTNLNKEFKKNESFVVIYGRRRVGKTTLIKEFLKDKTGIYYLATEEMEAQSMKRFAGTIARATDNPLIQKANFTDWIDLFQLVAEYKPGEKKVLVIDEFPYLVKTNPAFPSILQTAWDEILKNSQVMLILCGSFIGMMQKYALSYDSPLYGRKTSQIRLSPLSFTEVYASQNLSFEDAVAQYAITGGVPKYLDFFNDVQSLPEQIQENILYKNGFLYEEPYFLLKSESMNAINYFSIIKMIADGNHKLGKLANAMGEKTSSLSPYLATLTDLGFIEKRTPLTEKNPERSRKGLYFIADNFMRFWFRYVYPFKGELELDNTQIVLDEMHKDFYTKFVAFAYEDICKDIFLHMCKTKEIDFIPSRIGSYWQNDLNSDTEIDIMAVDHQNKRLFVGECKFHTKEVDIHVYHELKGKVSHSTEIYSSFQDYTIIYGIFSKSGFSERMTEASKSDPSLILIQENHVIRMKQE